MIKTRRNRKRSIDDSATEIEQYEELEKIGEGGFGVVYKARHRVTNQTVAVKKIPSEERGDGMHSSTIREITILKELRHPNIVRLLNVVFGEEATYLIFEYLDSDLKTHILTCPEFAQDHHRLVKIYLWQLLRAIAFCHSRGVIHRDLKPRNLLIDRQTNSLKIADFGLARTFSIPVRSFTNRVFTLWYRAPEIVLGDQQYSVPCDIWSIGCTFAEMVNRQPLFPGNSEIDELFKIFRIMGTPNEDCWTEVTSLPNFKSNFPKWPPKDMAEVVPNLEAAGQDLLSKMLQLDPVKRITALQALDHEYFKDVGSY